MQSAGAAGGRRTVRIVIVDDDELFRSGLAALLSREADLEVVGEARDGRGAARRAADLKPDVVLLDLELPDLSPPDVIAGILTEHRETRVVALVSLADEKTLDSAAAAGACGFLPKESRISEVAGAVRAAAEEGAWLSQATADHLLQHLERPEGSEASGVDPLSGRQARLLRLVADGSGDREIADTLKMSPGTVQDEVAEILARLPLARGVAAAG